MKPSTGRIFFIQFLSVLFLVSPLFYGTASAEPNHAETFEMARAANPAAYDYAMKNKVDVVSTDDGRTFLLW